MPDDPSQPGPAGSPINPRGSWTRPRWSPRIRRARLSLDGTPGDPQLLPGPPRTCSGAGKGIVYAAAQVPQPSRRHRCSPTSRLRAQAASPRRAEIELASTLAAQRRRARLCRRRPPPDIFLSMELVGGEALDKVARQRRDPRAAGNPGRPRRRRPEPRPPARRDPSRPQALQHPRRRRRHAADLDFGLAPPGRPQRQPMSRLTGRSWARSPGAARATKGPPRPGGCPDHLSSWASSSSPNSLSASPTTSPARSGPRWISSPPHRHAPPQGAPPARKEDLEGITAKCLAKDPAARYQTAAELAGDLRLYIAPAHPGPASTWDAMGQRPAATA